MARAIGEAYRHYTRMINFGKNWRGYLWQGRFASYPLDEKYLLAAVRYIELNPVRAGLVKVAWIYPWSSAATHIQGKDNLLVKVRPTLEIIGDWRDFLSMGVSDAETEILRKHMQTGRPLGSEDFISTLQKRLGRILRPQKPRPKKLKDPNEKK